MSKIEISLGLGNQWRNNEFDNVKFKWAIEIYEKVWYQYYGMFRSDGKERNP